MPVRRTERRRRSHCGRAGRQSRAAVVSGPEFLERRQVFAAVGFTGSAYTQTFDALGSSASAWTNDSTLAAWSLFDATGAAETSVLVGDGAATTGSFYNFGAASGPDRALGAIASLAVAFRQKNRALPRGSLDRNLGLCCEAGLVAGKARGKEKDQPGGGDDARHGQDAGPGRQKTDDPQRRIAPQGRLDMRQPDHPRRLFLVAASVVLLVNVAVDIAYARVDARVSYD